MIVQVHSQDQAQPKSYSFSIQEEVIVGRNPSKGITLDERTASRQHLSIQIKITSNIPAIIIKDLGSSNGTFINGKQLQPHKLQMITSKDKIKLANHNGYISVRINTQNDDKQQKQNKKEKKRKFSSSDSSSSSSSSEKVERSRQKKIKKIGISESTMKMLKDMTSEKKSKSERIKFLKLMGYKNAEQQWDEIQAQLKNQSKVKKFSNSRDSTSTNHKFSTKKATEQLQKQFSLGRSIHQKKGLGSTK